MNLPTKYQPSVVSDHDETKRMMLLAIELSSGSKSGNNGKKPTLADMDEYQDFCRAADRFPARTSRA